MVLGDIPAPSYIVSSLGWLTHMARCIGLRKVTFLGHGLHQLPAVERKPPPLASSHTVKGENSKGLHVKERPPSLSLHAVSERRGRQKPLTPDNPWRPPHGLHMGHLNAPIVLILPLGPTPWHLVSCPWAFPRNAMPLPHFPHFGVKAPPPSLGLSLQGASAGVGSMCSSQTETWQIGCGRGVSFHLGTPTSRPKSGAVALGSRRGGWGNDHIEVGDLVAVFHLLALWVPSSKSVAGVFHSASWSWDTLQTLVTYFLFWAGSAGLLEAFRGGMSTYFSQGSSSS